MPNMQLIKSTENIYLYPEITFRPEGKTLTLGDLHANSVALFHSLVINNMIDVDQKTYEKFVALYLAVGSDINTINKAKETIEFYRKKNVSNKEIDKANETIDKTKQRLIDTHANIDQLLSAIKANSEPLDLRLIGDEFSDRGVSDSIMMKMLKFLSDRKIKVHILASNHGHEFIKNTEALAITTSTEFKPEYTHKDAYVNQKSLCSLNMLIANKIIDKNEFLTCYGTYYKPALKLIDYHLTDDSIELFTHAPVPLNIIKRLALEACVEYHDHDAKALATTIDLINDKFQAVVNNNSVTTAEHYVSDLNNPNNETSAFNELIWNRWKNVDDEDKLRPAQINNTFYHKIARFLKFSHTRVINIVYVHGHDGETKNPAPPNHVANLDTRRGKKPPPVVSEITKYEKELIIVHCSNKLLNQTLVSKTRPSEPSLFAQMTARAWVKNMLNGFAFGLAIVGIVTIMGVSLGMGAAIAAASVVIGLAIVFALRVISSRFNRSTNTHLKAKPRLSQNELTQDSRPDITKDNKSSYEIMTQLNYSSTENSVMQNQPESIPTSALPRGPELPQVQPVEPDHKNADTSAIADSSQARNFGLFSIDQHTGITGNNYNPKSDALRQWCSIL